MPLGTKHRHQECDDRCVGRLEGIAEPTYDKEIEMETRMATDRGAQRLRTFDVS